MLTFDSGFGAGVGSGLVASLDQMVGSSSCSSVGRGAGAGVGSCAGAGSLAGAAMISVRVGMLVSMV